MEVDGGRPSSAHGHRSACKAHQVAVCCWPCWQGAGVKVHGVLAKPLGRSLFLFPSPRTRLGASGSWVGDTRL